VTPTRDDNVIAKLIAAKKKGSGKSS
jgi:hypothetical protein